MTQAMRLSEGGPDVEMAAIARGASGVPNAQTQDVAQMQRRGAQKGLLAIPQAFSMACHA